MNDHCGGSKNILAFCIMTTCLTIKLNQIGTISIFFQPYNIISNDLNKKGDILSGFWSDLKQWMFALDLNSSENCQMLLLIHSTHSYKNCLKAAFIRKFYIINTNNFAVLGYGMWYDCDVTMKACNYFIFCRHYANSCKFYKSIFSICHKRYFKTLRFTIAI